MQVQGVLVSGSPHESWTVLDDRGVIEPVERFLAYLTDVERSPNTIKAYAHHLKDWFVFLRHRGIDWRQVGLENVGEFVAWLRLPPAGRAADVTLLPSAGHHRGPVTVNRKLAAVSGFYVFHSRHGVALGDLVTELAPVRYRRTGWRPFLAHRAGDRPQRRRTVELREPKRLPTVLPAVKAQAVLDACTRLRDRFLFVLLWESGIRIGEALGLRHEDIAVAEGELSIRRRVNANQARAKSISPRTVPIGADVVRLYGDYLQEEYGDLDSDYVFVNLWAGTRGRPMSYAGVYDLVQRLRRDTGVDFDPHWFRHTYATRLLRAGTPIEVISNLLGHASVATTINVYGHLNVEDARKALEKAGLLTGKEVTW
jgi:integrase/recombinase XerD